jgi:hypothetical protein
MAASVLELFRRHPPGYSPGVTLGRALADLQGTFVAGEVDKAGTVLGFSEGSLSCEVRESVERHFLMHIVGLEFALHVPAVAVPGARIRVRNTGLLFRTGIACVVPAQFRTMLKPLMERIESDRELENALMKLDFRRCEINGSEQGWTVRIEPYGASEVVNRMPSFRRYIRLGREQAGAMAEALNAFGGIFAQNG